MNDSAATTIGTAQIAVFRHHYGGASQEPVQSRFMDSISPLTGKVHAIVAKGCSEDVNRAVKAAAAAGRNEWYQLAPTDRCDALSRMAQLMRERHDRLYAIDAVDTGLTKTACEQSFEESVQAWEFYANLAQNAADHHPSYCSDGELSSYRIPVGVVAIILPAMYSMLDVSRYAAAALSCGNTVVIKPSEFANRSALALAELAQDAELPPGIFNVVCGTGEDTGNVLARHPLVDHVCFVGSSETGQVVAANASNNLSGITCELGAKNSVVVFDDADLDAAADAAVELAFLGNGQSNFCAQSVLIQELIRKQLTTRILSRVSALQTGNPLRSKTDIGPLICEQNRDRADCFVRMAINDGARILAGGEALSGGKYGDGFFFQPTVLDQVTPRMTVATEEVRGPIIALMGFETDDQALDICNESRYGLATWLFTEDSARTERFTNSLATANVVINRGAVSRSVLTISPLGESGVGTNLGFDVISALTRVKTIHRR